MVVVHTKTIERVLLPFGIPDGPNVLVVGSTSGYIIRELFLKLINEILIPDINFRQSKYKLPDAQGLLIVDGATQHQSEVISSILEKANIGLHFLVAHSSHLTQPLDACFFKNLKADLKRNCPSYTDLSKSSNRLVHALACVSKTAGWFMGLQSWHHVGFLVSLEKDIPTLFYDLDAILKQQNSPVNEVKVKAIKSKRKREKVFFSGEKKIIAATDTLSNDEKK